MNYPIQSSTASEAQKDELLPSNGKRVAWVGNYAAHYYRTFHRCMEQMFPGRMRFFYVRRAGAPKGQYEFEMGELPDDVVLIDPELPELLLRDLKEFAPSLLIAAGHHPRPVRMAIQWARKQKIKVAYLCDTNIFDMLSRPFWEQWFQRFVRGRYLRHMWRLFAMGSSNLQYYEWCCGKKWTQSRAARMPLPHDPAAFTASGRELRTKLRIEDKFVVLSLGRLKKIKGVDRLLRGASMLPRDIRDECHFVVGGDGPERQHLEDLAAGLGISSCCTFLGAIDSDRTPPVFAAADLFVLPSSSEPWGLVVHEALSSGIPVMAPIWVGSAQDLIRQGVTGFVLQDNAACTLRDGLIRAFENRDQLPKMGLQGRQMIQNNRWTIDGSTEGIVRVIQQLDRSGGLN